ncbi:MAG: ribulokinase [Planctomycetes bacterium]|nr:ribulokinase [Planctomycetota bacterium]
MAQYSLGLDFGTESARALLVELGTGRETATAVAKYKHGVIDHALPSSGEKLPGDWALQHPKDYLTSLGATVRRVLKDSGVSAEDIVGIGIDFTSATIIPVDQKGTPLCFKDEFADVPHAWVKLWKHHGAQRQADRMNEVASDRGEAFLQRCGGRISSEYLFPKIWETLENAPAVYDAAWTFVEGGDWVVWQLTGQLLRNACAAGYKALWSKSDGFPSSEFFRALDPRLKNVVSEKIHGEVVPAGQNAGGLTARMAKKLGLKHGTPVGVGGIDAHVAVPGATVVGPGTLCLVMGTSFCHMIVHPEFHAVSGICGIVEDGIIPGYFGYEAGQAAGGDVYAWFVNSTVPAEYAREARKRKIDLHALLEEKAGALGPGGGGLVALDWLNGNRSVLNNTDLSGAIVGLTLGTKPEEIYRALIEATAFGTRTIIENFEAHGIGVDSVCACGGLPEKNRLVMRIFADVTGREFGVAASQQATALGAAMFGAVAAGSARGGYDSIVDAAANMARRKDERFAPDAGVKSAYDDLFAEYTKLYDYFGRGANNVMANLKRIKGYPTT